MTKWLTLQETAEKCGVRKGTLCMWRTRNKFPFKTKGTGRSLRIEPASVDAWMEENKEEIASGKLAVVRHRKYPLAMEPAGRRWRFGEPYRGRREDGSGDGGPPPPQPRRPAPPTPPPDTREGIWGRSANL